jgi:two-component system phosphate regulon sensor histidine kinase PhoR
MRKWVHSLGARVFLLFTLLIVFSCVGIYTLVSRELTTFYIQREKESLLQKGHILAPFFTNLLNNHQDPQPWVKKMGSASGVRITLIAPEGKVLADSQHDPKTMGNHWNRPEVQEALKKDVGASKRYSVTLNTYLLYVATPLKGKTGNLMGVLRLSFHLSSLKRPLIYLERKIISGLMVLLLFTLLLALLLSRGVTKWITQIALAAQALSQGNFQVRAPIHKTKELSILARSFNSMASSLEETFKQVEEERRKLETLISAIPNLVVVTNKEGNILFANKAFKALHSKKQASIWDAMRSPLLVDLFSQVWKEGEARGEIPMEDTEYEVMALVLVPKREALFLFHDITERARLNKMKTEFVTNLSHELKTPLTVMKGYIETMEMASSLKEAEGFIQVVKRHMNRIINLVSDLSLLSSIEERRSYKKEPVDFGRMAQQAIEWARPLAQKKGLQLEYHLPEGPVEVKGVAHLLEQLLTNLLDNAINYTDQGSVSLKIECINDQVEVMVQDTGVGIPKEHLHRVFERFYRVDPSRSRASGGTGLGLAIVKHIVQLHGGRMEIESKVSKSTRVTVIIPKAEQL